MRLKKIDYAIPTYLCEHLKERLSKVSVSPPIKQDGIESYILNGAKIRIDVPSKKEGEETLISIIGDFPWFNQELTNLPWGVPRYIKRILNSTKVGKGYRAHTLL